MYKESNRKQGALQFNKAKTNEIRTINEFPDDNQQQNSNPKQQTLRRMFGPASRDCFWFTFFVLKLKKLFLVFEGLWLKKTIKIQKHNVFCFW